MERFFISGCQRSGTTMLRLVLESHPHIHCFDEAVGYKLLIAEAMNEFVDFKYKNGAKIIGYKIPRFSEQLTRQRFDDPDYGDFPSFYKGNKVIFVFRDVLDVLGSMMKLRVDESNSWLEKYGLGILQAMLSSPNTDSYYIKKYEYVERAGFPAHLVGALYWAVKNQGFFDLCGSNAPVYPVEYENLVASPKDELIPICRFLGLDWDEALLNHPAHSHDELDAKGKAIGETDPLRGIDTRSVGGYRTLLTESQIREVIDLVGEISSRIDLALRP